MSVIVHYMAIDVSRLSHNSFSCVAHSKWTRRKYCPSVVYILQCMYGWFYKWICLNKFAAAEEKSTCIVFLMLQRCILHWY